MSGLRRFAALACIFAGSHAFAQVSLLTYVPPDRGFLGSVKTMAVLEVDDPFTYTVMNPLGGVLPLFGMPGAAIGAAIDADRSKEVRREFTELLQKHEVRMGGPFTALLLKNLQAIGIDVRLISGARTRKGLPVLDPSKLEFPSDADALLDVVFFTNMYMAVGNMQDFEPQTTILVRIFRASDKALVYQQMIRYSREMKGSNQNSVITTEYTKGVAFPNQKAIYDAPDKALDGFRQGIEPLAARLLAEMRSWR